MTHSTTPVETFAARHGPISAHLSTTWRASVHRLSCAKIVSSPPLRRERHPQHRDVRSSRMFRRAAFAAKAAPSATFVTAKLALPARSTHGVDEWRSIRRICQYLGGIIVVLGAGRRQAHCSPRLSCQRTYTVTVRSLSETAFISCLSTATQQLL